MAGRRLDDITWSEWLDVAWWSLLDRGNHGFSDSQKWRTFITEFVFEGKLPEQTAEEKAEAAKKAIGAPAPRDAFAEARALRERMGRNAKQSATSVSDDV